LIYFGENCNYELKNLHPDTRRVFSGVSNAHPTFNNTTITFEFENQYYFPEETAYYLATHQFDFET
jgi:hypothetical protein